MAKSKSPTEHETTGVVDPGKNMAGVALFWGTKLVSCSLVEGKDELALIRAVAEWFPPLDVLITEGQEVYPGPRRSNPNDLFPLTFVCGGVHALKTARERYVILPRIWTKGTPKEIRLKRLPSLLDEKELAIYTAVKRPKAVQHNVGDAVNIGKWFHANRSLFA